MCILSVTICEDIIYNPIISYIGWMCDTTMTRIQAISPLTQQWHWGFKQYWEVQQYWKGKLYRNGRVTESSHITTWAATTIEVNRVVTTIEKYDRVFFSGGCCKHHHRISVQIGWMNYFCIVLQVIQGSIQREMQGMVWRKVPFVKTCPPQNTKVSAYFEEVINILANIFSEKCSLF